MTRGMKECLWNQLQFIYTAQWAWRWSCAGPMTKALMRTEQLKVLSRNPLLIWRSAGLENPYTLIMVYIGDTSIFVEIKRSNF